MIRSGTSVRRTHLDGRIEKRVPMAVNVYLARTKQPHASEKALTENVGSHGARVRTKQFCQPGDELLITPLRSDFPQIGRVVYCQPGANGSFCVGVKFEGRSIKWADSSSGMPA